MLCSLSQEELGRSASHCISLFRRRNLMGGSFPMPLSGKAALQVCGAEQVSPLRTRVMGMQAAIVGPGRLQVQMHEQWVAVLSSPFPLSLPQNMAIQPNTLHLQKLRKKLTPALSARQVLAFSSSGCLLGAEGCDCNSRHSALMRGSLRHDHWVRLLWHGAFTPTWETGHRHCVRLQKATRLPCWP